MATLGAQLLSKIIRTGQIMSVVDYGINADDFPTVQEKAMYGMLIEEYQSLRANGGVIGPNLAQYKFPTFDLCDDPHTTIDQLCYEVRKSRLIRETKQYGEQLVQQVAAGKNPLEAIASAQERFNFLLGLGNARNVNVSFERGMQQVLNDYAAAEGGQLTGVLETPWPILTEATGGYQRDDFHIYYGRPKSMKTFVLSYQIAHSWLQRKRVLVYTKEMTPVNIIRRVGAFVGELPYHELRRGILTRADKEQLIQLNKYIQTQREATNGAQSLDVLSGLDIDVGGDTVEWLFAQVEKYKPDVLFIDGLYLLSCSKNYTKEHDRLRHNSRMVRTYQLRTGIPIGATVQANRGAEGNSRASTGDIGGTDAFGQDATIITRVINEPNDPTIALIFAGSREFRLNGIRIHAVPCTNFGFKEEISEKDIERAIREDGAGESSPTAVRRGRGKKQQAAPPVDTDDEFNLAQWREPKPQTNLVVLPGGLSGPTEPTTNLSNGYSWRR